MKDNNDHIIMHTEDLSIEHWIFNVMQTYLNGTYNVQYRGQKTNWFDVEKTHQWDFYVNEYRVVKARRYVIKIDKEDSAELVRTYNDITDLPIGIEADGSKYILMEEVQY